MNHSRKNFTPAYIEQLHTVQCQCYSLWQQLQLFSRVPIWCQAAHLKTGTADWERGAHTVQAEGRVDAASRCGCDSLRSEVTERFGGVTSVSNGSECAEQR